MLTEGDVEGDRDDIAEDNEEGNTVLVHAPGCDRDILRIAKVPHSVWG